MIYKCICNAGEPEIGSRGAPPTPAAQQQAEAEAVAATKASWLSGDITWEKAVTVAMADPPQEGEEQPEREARVLKLVLEAGLVPDDEIGKVTCTSSGRHEMLSMPLQSLVDDL